MTNWQSRIMNVDDDLSPEMEHSLTDVLLTRVSRLAVPLASGIRKTAAMRKRVDVRVVRTWYDAHPDAHPFVRDLASNI